MLAPKLDRHGSEDQGAKQGHEGQIKPRKNGSVDVGKRGEERATTGDEPDFIAIPDRTDGIQKDPAFRR